MKQWEIYVYPFDLEQPHPAVIISNDERCEDGQMTHVNALICSSIRLSRLPKNREILLDEADGLDWKTAVRCDIIHLLPKSRFQEKRGVVTRPRRVQIARKIIETLRLPTF